MSFERGYFEGESFPYKKGCEGSREHLEKIHQRLTGLSLSLPFGSDIWVVATRY